MRISILAGLLAVSSSVPAITPAQEANTFWAYQRIFATAASLEDVMVIVRRVRPDETLRVPAVLDYMAELMITRQAETPEEELARKEMVESLGRYGGHRYDTVIHKIASDWAPSKARIAARLFAKGRIDPKTPQYLVGDVDLPALRERMIAEALAAPEATDAAAHRLSEIAIGTSLDEVIAIMGRPQAVSGRTPWTLTRDHNVIFYYRGIGRVAFKDAHWDISDWRVEYITVEPLGFEDFMPYRSDPAKYGQPDAPTLAKMQLLTGHPWTVRTIVERTSRQRSATPEFMDIAAELLYTQRAQPMNAFAADAYAWVCMLLRRDGGPRYAQVLDAVATSTTEDHVRSHCQGGVSGGREAQSGPYVPGSLSLDAMRAKYPSIYPARAFHVYKPEPEQNWRREAKCFPGRQNQCND